jgi:hypothetical protein
MDTTVTLHILGDPVTFSSRVEACKIGRVRPGPCPKDLTPGDGKPGIGKKKAVAKGPDPSRGVSDRDKAVNQRHAEVAKILKKKDHFGTPTSEIPKILTIQGEKPGWTKPNLGDMSVKYRGQHGDAEIRLHQQGWQAIAPGNPQDNLPPLHQVFPDFNSAHTAVLKNAGPRRVRKNPAAS